MGFFKWRIFIVREYKHNKDTDTPKHRTLTLKRLKGPFKEKNSIFELNAFIFSYRTRMAN